MYANSSTLAPMFQSTFPQGERLGSTTLDEIWNKGFNPRSRKGNDGFENLDEDEVEVSIHVPARGTTKVKDIENLGYDVSIHVPARGTTKQGEQINERLRSFNPRSRKGND